MTPHEMSDFELIAFALQMYLNFIQTGDPCLSSADAENQKLELKALSVDQMRLIVRISDLAEKVKRKGKK